MARVTPPQVKFWSYPEQDEVELEVTDGAVVFSVQLDVKDAEDALKELKHAIERVRIQYA